MRATLLSLLGLSVFLVTASAQQSTPVALTNATVVEIEGVVEVLKLGAAAWQPARTNGVMLPGDRLRAGEHSRALLRVSPLQTIRVGEFGLIEMPREDSRFGFLRGIFYFFHRDKPGTLPLRTPAAMAVIRGTEFNLLVEENGRTTLSVLDGNVEMSNGLDQLNLNSMEEGIADPGLPLRRSPVLNAVNVIQWALYYPAVLDLDELGFGAAEQQVLALSIAAYRAGDLLAAVASYPAGRQPATDQEKIYLAALLVSVGQVEKAEAQLTSLTAPAGETVAKLANALRELMAAVKGQTWNRSQQPTLATEWMAESYYRQSQADLEGARQAARAAVTKSPSFGFDWERLAELEFSFGRIGHATEALEKSFALAPRNAQAFALNGFLLAAENRISKAIESFERAISVDGALGNAWLGRGLCRIRRGDSEGGREDLQIASTLEPQRALLRSYLGKSFSNAGDNRRANKELELARKLDPNDPTAWLYLALIKEQENQINEAVRDLERSGKLNNNRRLYRSRLLLDQDQAVCGANLARIYQDAGMLEVSVREAVRAINTDYANYSAHLFLANSYDALRDPRQINLRYETPWLSEYLVANLLAPVGAGTLSPYVTQQEYSKLFERDRFGLVSSTEYFSRGDWSQTAAQYGIYENSSYAAEVSYRSENGHRPNNDLEELTASLRVKQQMTPKDSLYGQVIYYDAEAGDVNQYFDEAVANPGLRVKEKQEPIVLAGYHHEWAPGSHSLLLAARLADRFQLYNPRQQTLLFDESLGAFTDVIPTSLTQSYRSALEIYTIEAQQIWQQNPHAFIVGGRFQSGQFETQNRQSNPLYPTPIPVSLEADQNFTTDFQRITGYGYYQLRIVDPLLLIAGVTYDRLKFPENFRYAPISTAEQTKEQVSPKAGFIWTPTGGTTVRGAYSKSLGGASFDQSFQLEPSQVAGFNQAFRSIIPESVVGANAGAPFETWGISLEQKFPTGTYLGVSGELLESQFDRSFGVFDAVPLGFFGFEVLPATTRERLGYRERSLLFTANQLLGQSWSIGARYRFSVAELDDQFPDIPPSVNLVGGFRSEQNLESVLHQLHLFVLFNHGSGFFAQAESIWSLQSNRGYEPDRPGDDFWQFNLFAGYRFPRRRAEVRVGLLNITDRDYRLNPLNLHPELPHERTFTASLRFSF